MASRACGMKDEHMFASALAIPDHAVAPPTLLDRWCHPKGWVPARRTAASVAAFQHLASTPRDRLTPSVLGADSDRFHRVQNSRQVAAEAPR
jgi:hypothetical protein